MLQYVHTPTHFSDWGAVAQPRLMQLLKKWRGHQSRAADWIKTIKVVVLPKRSHILNSLLTSRVSDQPWCVW